MNVHRADPQLRVTALIAVVVTLVAGVALFVALQRWFATVTKLPSAEALAQLLTAFAWATGSICAAILWLAASRWRSGGRACPAAQWPLPGAHVIRDTKTLRGGAAVTRGRVMQGTRRGAPPLHRLRQC